MKKYILIYEINDYEDCGGGTKFNFFEKIEDLEKKVNELKKDSRMEILYSFELKEEIKFKAVEKVIKWEVE